MILVFYLLVLRPHDFHARLASGNDLYVVRASVVRGFLLQHSVHDCLYLSLRLFHFLEAAGADQLFLAQPEAEHALELQHICLEFSEHAGVNDHKRIALHAVLQLLLMCPPVVQEQAR